MTQTVEGHSGHFFDSMIGNPETMISLVGTKLKNI